jgi:hypothetical protein
MSIGKYFLDKDQDARPGGFCDCYKCQRVLSSLGAQDKGAFG